MHSRTINSCRRTALAAALRAFAAATAAAQQFRVAGATLKADDARPTGQCPVTVVFRGAIRANGAGRVTYTFTRSDGATSPVYELEFKGAGTQRVETTWTLGDAQQLPRYDGWMAVKVLSPNQLESNHATGRFTLTCAASQPPGRRIVFTSERDGNYEIYSMNADGSGQTNLTLNPADDVAPRLSPDGARVVFESNRDGNYEIYSMNLDGTGLRRLTDDPRYDRAPNWSPDGQRIVFARGSGLSDDTELYVMNADGSGLTRLSNNSVSEEDPSWSPDGTKIAFETVTPGGSHIYLLDLSTGATIQLTNDPKSDNRPDWSPDGAKIVFTRNDMVTDTEVWVMNADGSGQTDITNDPSLTDGDPAWSPDGQKIVFVKGPLAGPFNIYLMNADGSGQTQITTTDHDSIPDW